MPLGMEPVDEPSSLLAAVAEARSVLADLRRLHEQLATHPEPHGSAEQALAEALARRDELAERIGALVIGHLAAGGDLLPVEVEAEGHGARPGEDPSAGEQVDADEEADPHGPSPDDDEAPAADDEAPAADETDDEAPAAEPPATVQPSAEPDPPEAPAPAPTVPPRGRPLSSAELLEQLSRASLGPSWADRPPAPGPVRVLRRALAAIGPAKRPTTANRASDLVDRLSRSAARMDDWLALAKGDQQALLGLISSMARHLQDEAKQPLNPDDAKTLKSLFSTMSHWSRTHQPGFVLGLGRNNQPEHGSWLRDAQHWEAQLRSGLEQGGEDRAAIAMDRIVEVLEAEVEPGLLIDAVKGALSAGVSQSDPRLIDMLVPHASLLKGARKFKTLKAHLKQAGKEQDETVEADDRSSLIPDDWPHFKHTEGKRAVIIGGDPRRQAAKRIGSAFRFDTVEWLDSDARRVQSLANSVRSGSIDVVILLRSFISHRHVDMLLPAVKDSPALMVLVDMGYGVTQVKQAIERFGG